MWDFFPVFFLSLYEPIHLTVIHFKYITFTKLIQSLSPILYVFQLLLYPNRSTLINKKCAFNRYKWINIWPIPFSYSYLDEPIHLTVILHSWQVYYLYQDNPKFITLFLSYYYLLFIYHLLYANRSTLINKNVLLIVTNESTIDQFTSVTAI